MPNKPVPPQSIPVSDVDEERLYISDPQNRRRLVGHWRDHVVIDAHGERRYVRDKTLIMTADGRTINPEKPISVFDCSACGREFLSLFSIRYCEGCQRVLCLNCTQALQMRDTSIAYYCVPCFQRLMHVSYLRFFFSLGKIL